MEIRKRKLNRLSNWDYSENGYYFVTICVKDRENKFGMIINHNMKLSNIGMIAEKIWTDIPKHFGAVQLDTFVIMPNHIHGIIIIDNPMIVGNADLRSLQSRDKMLLPKIIQQFKSVVTRKLKENNIKFQWQKSYYDHIIRNETSLERIREYIANNPLKWELDIENSETLIKKNIKEYYNVLYEKQ